VVDQKNRTVAAGRDLQTIQADTESRGVRSDAWEKAVQRWERRGVKEWSFGDLPESIVVEQIGGSPLLAYPGVELREGAVDVRLFRTRADAESVSRAGVRRLGELALERDLSRTFKELGGLARQLTTPPMKAASFQDALQKVSASLTPAASGAVPPELLQKSAYEHLLHAALTLEPVFPLTEVRFRALVESARKELPALTYRLAELTKQILALRQTVLASSKRYPTLEQDVQRLVPPDFLAHTPPERLPHLLRYLRAVQIRAERAAISPAKDAEKAQQLAPFSSWRSRVAQEQHETFRWLLEEFRVSIFAQELRTAKPVSAQRLKALGEFT
jgi:ATP-dependent helicase HrpA